MFQWRRLLKRWIQRRVWRTRRACDDGPRIKKKYAQNLFQLILLRLKVIFRDSSRFIVEKKILNKNDDPDVFITRHKFGVVQLSVRYPITAWILPYHVLITSNGANWFKFETTHVVFTWWFGSHMCQKKPVFLAELNQEIGPCCCWMAGRLCLTNVTNVTHLQKESPNSKRWLFLNQES